MTIASNACRKTTLVLMLAMLASGSLAQAVERTITPVDANGNPTGPSRTIHIPDEPDSTTVVQPVDVNGNPAGEPVHIPDGITTPAAPPDDGMVPEEPAPGSEEASEPPDSGAGDTPPG